MHKHQAIAYGIFGTKILPFKADLSHIREKAKEEAVFPTEAFDFSLDGCFFWMGLEEVEREHLVRAAVENGLGDVGAAMEGVGGDDAFRNAENRQHLNKYMLRVATARVDILCKTPRKPAHFRLPSTQAKHQESLSTLSARWHRSQYAFPLPQKGRSTLEHRP